MLVKVLIVLALLAIVISLGGGLFFLVHDKGESTRTVKALTMRIVLSILLVGLLMLGYLAGVIKPHGIYGDAPSMPATRTE